MKVEYIIYGWMDGGGEGVHARPNAWAFVRALDGRWGTVRLHHQHQLGLFTTRGILCMRTLRIPIVVYCVPSEAHQQLLELGSSELERMGEMVPGVQVSYSLQCAELCHDFQEDLHFHFSLGLNSLSVYNTLSLHLLSTHPSPIECGQQHLLAGPSEEQTLSPSFTRLCRVCSSRRPPHHSSTGECPSHVTLM